MYITATGMVCSVGLNAQAACAAMRGGISNFEELPYYDNQGEPVVGAMVPIPLGDYTSKTWRKDRLVEMLAMAIDDCLKQGVNEPLEHVPLLVGLAEPDRPGECGELGDAIINEVQRKLGVKFHPQFSKAISMGHTAGFRGIRAAVELFDDPQVPACLLCGVDSYINARSLWWLDEHWRLKTEENSDGVIPGEAAAAVLLRRKPIQENTPATRITGLGFGHEQAHVLSDDPLLGLGLTQATRSALDDAGLQIHETDFQISDVTGESYGFKDQALMIGRLLRVHKEGFPIWHCSEFIGDTGGAAGVCQLVIADHAFTKNYAIGDRVMCYTSAVTGDRAAVVIGREGTQVQSTPMISASILQHSN